MCLKLILALGAGEEVKREVERKVRSDKKREVKPVIKLELKDAIYRLSYITYTPVKDVCARLCMYVITDKHMIGQYARYFQRDIRLENTLYFGSSSNKRFTKRDPGETSRVTVRFTQAEYDSIAILSYALDCTPSRTVAILLYAAMRHLKYVNRYVKEYLDGHLSENQMRELRGVLKYINLKNEASQSWMSLIGTIVDEVSAPITRVKDAVSEYLATIKDKDK